ncbi:conjugal transfer protein TraV [Salmonella enterica]|nr:conjugal transfer protein TraV [Salmonella enterica]
MCTIHITPRCRRPARGQVFLKKLEVKGDSFSFTLPSRVFRLHPAPNPRVIYASDARTQGKVTGMRLLLPSSTDELITTAIWQVSVPDEAPFDVQHVIQWILPSPLASLMSDDTWLWPSVITRRYQCFPLAPLPEDRKYDSLPDLVLHPEQETIKCKEKHYSQPL